MPRGLHDDGSGLGISQDPRDLLVRGGLVDGHCDQARVPQCVVDERPLISGTGEQAHTLPGTQPGREKSTGETVDGVREVSRCHRRPAIV